MSKFAGDSSAKNFPPLIKPICNENNNILRSILINIISMIRDKQ